MYALPAVNKSMEGDVSYSSASTANSTNDDHEYVWDGFTHADQLAAAQGEDYYEDLELAARLGKTLLQKNKELDMLNYQMRCCNEEQSLEIEHLNKQINWLREVNESKTRMFEQLDVNYQDMESNIVKLRAETKEWKEKATKCLNTCESQEDQIQNLKGELDSIRKAQDSKKSKEKIRRRTVHGCLPAAKNQVEAQNNGQDPNLRTNSPFIEDDSILEEVEALHEVIANLRGQQVMDQRTIKEMKKDMEGIMQENQDYVEKIKDEREMIQRLNHIIEEYDKAVYQQAYMIESTPNVTDDFNNMEINFSDRSDDEDTGLPGLYGVHLASSLAGNDIKTSFQSPIIQQQAPLAQYLRITNSTPMKSPSSQRSNPIMKCSTSSMKTPSSQKTTGINVSSSHGGRVKSEPKNVSLVQELDTQYRTLLEKYEMLLHSIESERVCSPVKESHIKHDDTSSILTDSCLETESSNDSNEDANDRCLIKRTRLDPAPEYKRLFREIFDILSKAKQA